jgi:hypothetical protein
MDLRSLALRHWPLKLAALALAVLLWAGVASQEITTQLVPVRVDVEFADSLDLARPLPSVTALVSGPGHEILKLYSTPLVLRVSVPESAVRRAYRVRLTPERVQVPASTNVTVEELAPRDLLVSLARSTPRP